MQSALPRLQRNIAIPLVTLALGAAGGSALVAVLDEDDVLTLPPRTLLPRASRHRLRATSRPGTTSSARARSRGSRAADALYAMSQQNVELVGRGIEHWNETGEFDWATFADDVEWVVDPDAWLGDTYRGRDGIRLMLARLAEAFAVRSYLRPEEALKAAGLPE